MPVIVLLADGVRPDTLASAIARGRAPALARMQEEGGLHTVTTCFPSVTGPAYAPFLMGRHPADIGLPGLRWFDRARTTCTAPDFTRSYVGHQLRYLDRDLERHAPTIWEQTPDTLGALSVINRGLPRERRIGEITIPKALRAVRTHFGGRVAEWLKVDEEISEELVTRVRQQRPKFVFGALIGVDKASHSQGHESELVDRAIGVVDHTVERLRADAERYGYDRTLHLWVTSDHGHSPVSNHEDLDRLIQGAGYRVLAHPWVFTRRPDVAVMVSGNAMSHVYVDLASRVRLPWPALRERWGALLDLLVARESVDVAIVATAPGEVEVHSRDRGVAVVRQRASGELSYDPANGDPLGIGRRLTDVHPDAALEATMMTDYPDALLQVMRLAQAPRSGDIILSARRDWDFRARYEPIPHVSSHGALHRDHMLVPLLMNRPPASLPRRTVDVMPSALAALGLEIPLGLDGTSFVSGRERASTAA